MLTLDKIYHAAFVLKDVARKTDLIEAPRLSKDCQLYLKTENLQVTGSFKVRGAYYKISQLSREESEKGVIACSAGNHAQGVALAATRRGIRSIVCMPDGAPIMKEIIGVNGKPSYYIWGREVVLVDGEYLDSYADTVSKDTVFAFIFNFRDYIGNTNYAVTVRDYIDEATDDRIKKAIMLFDGKAVDTNSLVTLTKKKA